MLALLECWPQPAEFVDDFLRQSVERRLGTVCSQNGGDGHDPEPSAGIYGTLKS